MAANAALIMLTQDLNLIVKSMNLIGMFCGRLSFFCFFFFRAAHMAYGGFPG